MPELTRQNLIGFSSGDKVAIYCVVCHEEKNIPQAIYAAANAKGKGIYTHRNKIITEFTETHFERCVMRPLADAERAAVQAAQPLKVDTIEIATHRAAKNDFCFYQTLTSGKVRLNDCTITFREDDNDRLRAAIANLGFACRSFADAGIRGGLIILDNDKDGKDMRYGGEHNILFSLLFPQSYGENKKYAAIYAGYQQWLAKAKMLTSQYKITVKLGQAK